jgi:hypothetical protein
MKHVGNGFIIHGLFVDDMHILTNSVLMKEFTDKYCKDFDIKGGDLMETFFGMQVEQSDGKILFHLDKYIQNIITEFLECSDSLSGRNDFRASLDLYILEMTAL